MSKRREHEERLRAKLIELENEVDHLKQQIKETEAELLPEQHSKMERIKALSANAKEKLDELVDAGEDSWEHLKDGVEHYWESLGREIKSFEDM